MSSLVRKTVAAACGACLWLAASASAQVPSDAFVHARVSSVQVVLTPVPADPQVARNIEGSARRMLAVYPGDRFDAVRLEFGLSRVRRVAGVTSAGARVGYATDGGVDVVVLATTDGAPRARTLAQRLRLVDDGQRLLKATLSLKARCPSRATSGSTTARRSRSTARTGATPPDAGPTPRTTRRRSWDSREPCPSYAGADRSTPTGTSGT